MNTRRKTIQAKPSKPSVRWHLQHVAYHPLFVPESHEHIEYWYNIGATGVQRDLFRTICSEIFAQDSSKADPTYPADFTAMVNLEEAHLMLKYFGRLLTDDVGKPRVRVWILHEANRRRREHFRAVFAGVQTVFEKRSVMHTDYVPPEAEAYLQDRTHYHRRVDWTSLKARREMQQLQETRAASQGTFLDKHPSAIVAERDSVGQPRFTKPKSQFDGVNVLASFGYGDVPVEEAISDLKVRQHAHLEAERYYVDTDGSTVYKAGVPRRKETTAKNSGILQSVTSDPITHWKVKVCD